MSTSKRGLRQNDDFNAAFTISKNMTAGQKAPSSRKSNLSIGNHKLYFF
uniref:Uncharacterized protein n=1 Tax=Anguilla anguilla TaxID=7936 RepID=A0A0E9VG16_ANGAN